MPKKRHAAGPQDQPGHPSQYREGETLNEQLSRQPPTARTDRGADGKLLLPRGGTSELQIRDVRTREQQHESNCPQQNQKERSYVSHQVFVKSHHSHLRTWRASEPKRGSALSDRWLIVTRSDMARLRFTPGFRRPINIDRPK